MLAKSNFILTFFGGLDEDQIAEKVSYRRDI